MEQGTRDTVVPAGPEVPGEREKRQVSEIYFTFSVRGNVKHSLLEFSGCNNIPFVFFE